VVTEQGMRESDVRLDAIIRFFDSVQAAAERATRPVYAETCCCGGSVEVGREATAAERRRIQANFLGRHMRCTTPAPDNPGRNEGDES
jgi:hypothetical protein